MNRAFVVVVGLAVGLTGCADHKTKVQGRSQIGEADAADAESVVTVGSKTAVGNTEPLDVSGVGLVYRLPGTGSSPAPGGWRTMLENNLKKQGLDKIREVLDNPDRSVSLVIVTARIPPGARKGDPIDIQITVPDESKTTSLKGGHLLACDLVTHDTTGNIQSMVQTGRPGGPSGGLLLGNVWASAEGPVVAGAYLKPGHAADPDDGPPPLRAGRVWGGGRVTRTREFYLLLNSGDQTVRMAATVADRLCAAFHNTAEPNVKVAEAKTKELVVVNVPAAYRLNHYRFLLVARQVPLVPAAGDGPYRKKLEEELLNPETTISAAIKLEALGGDSHRQLRLGLRQANEWVRFAAAEALAYLGQTDGAVELAHLAEAHPALRASCLKALASMDDGAATDRLADLMAHPDPALRYGAFFALRATDERNPALGGVLVNKSFWVHQAARGSAGLVHLASDRRSEVVVFGEAKFRGPFTLPIGSEFTVSMPPEGDTVRVSRVARDLRGDAEVKEVGCGTNVAAVLVAVGKLGGGYSEAVELLTRADRAQVLTAGLAVDNMPREMTVEQMAKAAKVDPTLVRADVEVARVGSTGTDLGRVGFDLPPDVDPAGRQAEQPARPPLSQNPGRLFGPKYRPEASSGADPVPAGAAEPQAGPPPPGTLFGPKKPAARGSGGQ
jgi:hypothetical protein